jgi:hypothetical protein
LKYEFLRDELHAGKHAVRLQFTLPRGSYATMIVKWISAVDAEEDEQTLPEDVDGDEGLHDANADPS